MPSSSDTIVREVAKASRQVYCLGVMDTETVPCSSKRHSGGPKGTVSELWAEMSGGGRWLTVKSKAPVVSKGALSEDVFLQGKTTLLPEN